MAEAAKAGSPGLLDLEKELTCSVSTPRRWQVNLMGRADKYVARYVLKFFTNHSPSSTASIPSVVPASRNGSHGRLPKHLLRNRTRSTAHHAAPQYERPGRMPRSLRCWKCIYRPIPPRPEATWRKRRQRSITFKGTTCYPKSRRRKRVMKKARIGEWLRRRGR